MSKYNNNSYVEIRISDRPTVAQLLTLEEQIPGIAIENISDHFDTGGDTDGYEIVFELPANSPQCPGYPLLESHNWSYNINAMIVDPKIPSAVAKLLQQIGQTEEYLEEQRKRIAHKIALADYGVAMHKFNIEVRQKIVKIFNDN